MINRHQTPEENRLEAFNRQVQLARQSPEEMAKASPEVQEAAQNQASFAEKRKKYLGDK